VIAAGWWDVVADGERARRFGRADRQELLDAYCQLAIHDQGEAGLDILTDGGHRPRRYARYMRATPRRIP
jgi:methionine synthase II (cobalamin-independent)